MTPNQKKIKNEAINQYKKKKRNKYTRRRERETSNIFQ